MILNKERIDLIKATKTKTIKVIKDKNNNNMKENIYFQNILKNNNNSVKNLEHINPQIKKINDNLKDIFASDESKTKALKFILRKYEKEKNNNQIKVTLTEPENNIILFKDSIKTIKEKNNYNKRISYRNKLSKNYSENGIFKSENDGKDDEKKIKYKKIEYDSNIGYKTTIDNFRKLSNEKSNDNSKKKDISIENDYNYNNTYSSINYEKKNYTIYTKRDIVGMNKDQEKINNKNNNNEFIVNNRLYKVTKKIKIPKTISTEKNSLIPLNENKLKNKTLNSFYINKKPSTYSIYEDRNQLNKENLTYNLDYNNSQNMIFQENDKNYLNNNKNIDNNKRNIIRNHYKKKKIIK